MKDQNGNIWINDLGDSITVEPHDHSAFLQYKVKFADKEPSEFDVFSSFKAARNYVAYQRGDDRKAKRWMLFGE